MFISMKEILKNELFEKAQILAGGRGLTREVGRVSVFDCPCRDDILERDLIREGDVFITCLEQFKFERDNIYHFIDTLLQCNCAGLIVVTGDMLEVLTEEILQKCDEGKLPVILVEEDIPYAAVIDVINQYIAIDYQNALNMLKLEKIMYGNISVSEKMRTLYSINPDIKQYIRVIRVDGEFTSDIAQLELHVYYTNKKNDIYVRNGRKMFFILSDNDEKALYKASDAAAVRFSEFIDGPRVGYSRLHKRNRITEALEEADRALETAKNMNISSQTYDPLSCLQILLMVKDSQVAYDFYHRYVELIKRRVSAENLRETLKTMETYVASSGSFSETARLMNQHENTIRYRVNKVKSALHMEKDHIKFHETIAIAVKLRTLLHEEL